MLHPRLALAALVGLAFAAPRSGGAGRPNPQITVVYQLAEDHSPAAFEELKRETTFLLRGTGFPIGFKSRSALGPADEFDNIVIVRFQGVCRMDAAPLPPRRERRLAWTHSSHGEVLPFSEVSCDAVRDFIRLAVGARPGLPPEMLFGRALARVLAHEIYHVLARTGRHGTQGLAQPALTAEELIGARLELHREDLLRVAAETGAPD